jgi:MFS family permease
MTPAPPNGEHARPEIVASGNTNHLPPNVSVSPGTASSEEPTPESASLPPLEAASAHRFDRYFGTLWRHRDFRVLWLSLTITHFGGQITFLALPLTAAIMLHATPFEMGVLTMMQALPYTLFGLFTGVLVDRSRKLPLVVWTDIGRGGLLLLIPLAAWLGFLGMPILYVVSFGVGLGGIIGWAAYQVFMTERVGRPNLVEANSRIALSDSSAQLIGPGIAGALIHALTAPIAILLDALAYFISAVMLRGIKPLPSDAPKQIGSATWASIWSDAKEGLTLIWHNPLLRAISWGLAIWQMLRHAYVAIVILFAARELDLSPGKIGALYMIAGVGFLLASFTCQRLNERFGVGRVMLYGIGLTSLSWLAISLISKSSVAFLILGGALFVFDFGVMLFFINYLSLRQAATPDALLGRVTSTMIFLALSLSPLGSLAGGLLGEWLGLRGTIAVCGVGAAILVIAMFRVTPLPQMQKLPTPDTFPLPKPKAPGAEMAGD